jgi:hypothetical protein
MLNWGVFFCGKEEKNVITTSEFNYCFPVVNCYQMASRKWFSNPIL